jgi:hypothetical protein
MKRISVLLFLLVFCSATAMQAQAQAPKPDAEAKKLHVLVGHWIYEGEYQAGPLGPAGERTGEMTCQMVLGGFFIQCRETGKGPAGEWRALGMFGYDPVNKNYLDHVYLDNGSCLIGAYTLSGNTWTWSAKWPAGGKEYQARGTHEFAADLMSMADMAEISADGKVWTPLRKGKWTKVPPAPKK